MKPSSLFFTLTTLTLLLLSNPNPSSSSDNGEGFEAWCKKYDKSYASEQERLYRLGVFNENLAYINQHNDLGDSTYTLALNAFADLTHREFKASRLGGVLPPSLHSLGRKKRDPQASEVVDVPSEIDWRKSGAVTYVKDGGNCGSSWAFSATGAIEGINKITTGTLIDVSEQVLVDCDRVPPNNGCYGGLMENAFQFVIDNKGIVNQEDYPYKGMDCTCDKPRLGRHVVTIDNYTNVIPNNESELLKAVSVQPVSVAICGSGKDFQFYSEGIFTGPCTSKYDHGVLIVGYGSENAMDYWIVKNSWGRNWGMDGYILMLRYHSMHKGLCGINSLPSYPTKNSGNPPLPPPAPHPGPSPCVFFTCGEWQTCCCYYEVFGYCLFWTCCDWGSAVFCHNQTHCCLRQYPVIDTERNYCPRLMET